MSEAPEVDQPVSTPGTATPRPFGPRSTYDAGYGDALAGLPEGLHATVDIPWRAVRTGDTIVADDGAHLHVARSGWISHPREPGVRGEWGLTLMQGNTRESYPGDPDDLAPVLVPVGTADAVRLTREQIGAHVIATRANPDGTTDGDLLWRVGP
ncbi:MAG TPA: hypothetical protein VIU11_14375 [Nakamurella sp.]